MVNRNTTVMSIMGTSREKFKKNACAEKLLAVYDGKN